MILSATQAVSLKTAPCLMSATAYSQHYRSYVLSAPTVDYPLVKSHSWCDDAVVPTL